MKKELLKKDQRKVHQRPKKQLPEKYADLTEIGIIILLGIIVYSNSFSCTFHFDDFPIIVNNIKIQNLSDIRAWWNFYPSRLVGIFSFALNYHFNHLDVRYYHLVNLIIHLINACLVWWLTVLIFSSAVMKDKPVTRHKKVIAFFTALLFVSHPLATQVVTYIWQRIASMVTMFYILSLILYIKARLSNKGMVLNSFLFTGSLISAVLAMFTKENAFTLPFAIVLFEIFFLQTKKIMINFRDYRTILVLAAFTGVILIIPLKFSFSIFDTIPPRLGHIYTITPVSYLYTQFSAIVKYIQLLFLPVNQNFDYDFPVSHNFFAVRTCISFLMLMTLVIVAVFLFKRYRVISFGIFWFFLTLMIESSIIPLDDVIFEHRTYLPSFGFFLVLTTGLYILFRNKYKVFPIVILTGIVVINSYLTYARNKVWRDDLVFWSDNVNKSPNKTRPLYNRAIDYSNLGQWEKSLADYSKAIEIDPVYTDALSNRGGLYGKTGQWEKSMEDCSRVIKIDSNNFMAWFNRGEAYENLLQFDKAITDFSKAIRLDPGFSRAWLNRGIANAGIGQWDKAIEDCSQAISLDPRFAQAYYNRGIIYANLGQWDKVIADCSMTIEIDPSYVQAYSNRGTAYGNTGQMDKAINDYSTAINIAPNYTKAYANRAAAYERSGKWDKAIEDYSKAIEIDPAFTQAYASRDAAYKKLNGKKSR